MKNKLNVIEHVIHISIWISAVVYSLYQLVLAQTDIFEGSSKLNIENILSSLKPGWFLGQRKDESDLEWSTWKYFIQLSWFYMSLQFFISEFIRRTNIPILKYWYIVSSITFIVLYMGLKPLFIIVSQPIVFWIILYCGGKRISIWMTSLILLLGNNILKYKYFHWYFLSNERYEGVIIMLYAIAWAELRCISYCLDHINKAEKLGNTQDKDRNCDKIEICNSIINMFSYVMYLPVLFVGPMISYEEFEKSLFIRKNDFKLKIKRFVCDMTIYLIYLVLLEVAYHYIYFSALLNNLKALYKLPSIALCGGGLFMCFSFHIKYVISYGTTTSYARLDNIDPPPTPRCLAKMHVCSDIWRYFDIGLYKFLFTYIYSPVYNTLKDYKRNSKISCKLLSSFATFAFIFTWHGTSWLIFVWSVLNYFGFLLELTGKAISKCDKYKWFSKKVLRTKAMEVRFIAFLCAPLLCLSVISSVYFLAGSDVGDLYFGLTRWPSLYNFTLVYLSLYANCHIAITLQSVHSVSVTKIFKKCKIPTAKILKDENIELHPNIIAIGSVNRRRKSTRA